MDIYFRETFYEESLEVVCCSKKQIFDALSGRSENMRSGFPEEKMFSRLPGEDPPHGASN